MEEREAPAPRPEPLTYRIGHLKPPVWYDYAPLGSVILMSAAVLVICGIMIADSQIIPKLCGVGCLLAFGTYVVRFLRHFRRSRALVTQEAVLTETDLTVSNALWSKCFRLEDVVFSMSYSSATNLCVVVATEDDYVTINCSCGFLLSKNGIEALRPIYALNKRFMQWNNNHCNYIRNKRYRRKNPYKVPLFVFEVEYDTPRVTKLVDTLRKQYPFRWEQRGTLEEVQ